MPRLDLANVRHRFQKYFDSLQVPGEPYGTLRGGLAQEPDFYASADCAIIRTIWGEDLRKLPEQQRLQWIETLNSYQDPGDGSYQTFTHHSKLHANGTAIGALGALGGRMKHAVRLYDGFATPAEVVPWMDQEIDWAKQWTASHLFWGGMHCFSLSTSATPLWLDTVFAWLGSTLDPQSGFWRKGVVPFHPVEPLGGGAHIWPIYEHHGRAFPYPRQLIDTILAMQNARGSWLNAMGNPMTYLDLDALYGLNFARRAAQDYREADIREAVSRYAELVLGEWENTLSQVFTCHPHDSLAMIGAAGLLQRFLPQTLRDDRVWTDIFSDPALYRVRETEFTN